MLESFLWFLFSHQVSKKKFNLLRIIFDITFRWANPYIPLFLKCSRYLKSRRYYQCDNSFLLNPGFLKRKIQAWRKVSRQIILIWFFVDKSLYYLTLFFINTGISWNISVLNLSLLFYNLPTLTLMILTHPYTHEQHLLFDSLHILR